jgi:polysaccharide pyruvyl transferase WcaK-like protein
MSILIVPCNTRSLNMGDVAMLQVAVRRLRTQSPGRSLHVFTSDALALARHCGSVTPVELPDQPAWCADHYIGGRLHDYLPPRHSERLLRANCVMACRAPGLRERVLRLRAAWRPDERETFHRFIQAIDRARLVLVSGAGGLADYFPDYSNLMLLTLQCAQRRNLPTAMMGQGVGPLESHDMRAKAAAVLPHVDWIAVRERRRSISLLRAVGVAGDRLLDTGDDAVELAYEASPGIPGSALGVNLRLARSADTDRRDVGAVAAGIRDFLRTRRLQMLPVPIALQRNLDMDAIRMVMAAVGPDGTASVSGSDLDTPLSVIRQVGRCRLVITGAYHAAVFALSQGIPVVCVARSLYFEDKFLGLADEFGAGCHLVSLDAPDVSRQVTRALAVAHDEGPSVRAALLDAARRQLERGHAAYARLTSHLDRPHRAA